MVDNKQVFCISYYIRDEEDQILEKSEDGKVVAVVAQSGNLIPAVEKEVVEMAVGETRVIPVKCKDAYGQFDRNKVKLVPKSKINNIAKNIKEGQTIDLIAQSTGKLKQAKILSIQDESISLDFNHPYSGKDLIFEITLKETSTIEEYKKQLDILNQ